MSIRRLFASLTVVSSLIVALLVVEAGCAPPPTPEQQALALDQLRALVIENGNSPTAERLVSFEKQNSQTKAAALSRFLRGYQSFGAKNYPAAIDALSAKEIQTETNLGDYALYFWGLSLQQLNRNDEAFKIFDRLVKEHPESRFLNESRLRAGEALLSSGDAKGAVRYATELTSSATKPDGETWETRAREMIDTIMGRSFEQRDTGALSQLAPRR